VDLVPNNGAWLSNISEGGLGLDLFVPAVSGQAVRLGFYLPGTSNHIEANCQITWTDRFGQKAGLRFLDLSEASHERIKDWLFAPSPILWMRRLIRLFVGAVNSSGQRILTLVNHSGRAVNVAVTLKNLELSGDVTLQVYRASSNDDAQILSRP